MYCAKQRQTLTECVFIYSILFIRDNCRKEPHKRGSLYFIVQYTPRLSIYILDLCFIYNKPILCVVSPNQTCIIRVIQKTSSFEMLCSKVKKYCKNLNIFGFNQDLGCKLMPRGAPSDICVYLVILLYNCNLKTSNSKITHFLLQQAYRLGFIQLKIECRCGFWCIPFLWDYGDRFKVT